MKAPCYSCGIIMTLADFFTFTLVYRFVYRDAGRKKVIDVRKKLSSILAKQFEIMKNIKRKKKKKGINRKKTRFFQISMKIYVFGSLIN